MIDRSYLPFQSAREYRDRGMMKWMGFFLSEHTTSLDDDKHKVDMSTDLTRTDKLVLIGQLYASQLKGRFVVKETKEKKTHIGHVSELSPVEITIKTEQEYQLLQIEDILSISLMEENDYE
ncbi:MAG: hypothetical protein GX963_01445 [Bacteroidales bacterium]|nr:hypothetical protein [Bacteroidales bacterium]